MFLKNKKLFLGLALSAFLSFGFFALGGEYLHSRIHHHESKSSHDDCPVNQLLTQTFISILPIVLTAACLVVHTIRFNKSAVKSTPVFHFSESRAPPVSLI